MPWCHGLESWVLTYFSNLFWIFRYSFHFSLAKASKNAKERRREPGGIQIQTGPYQTFLWAVQNYKASGCEMLLPILPDSIVLSWQSVAYLCVLDVGSAQALQCTSYLSTFDSSCAFRGLVERFRFRRRTSAETRQDSLALQLCVGVLTSSQHDRWTWNIAWHAFWTFPTKTSYGYKSATSASELSWDLGTLLALDTNPTESLWDHSFSLAGLLNGSVMGCSATVLSIFSWLPQF